MSQEFKSIGDLAMTVLGEAATPSKPSPLPAELRHAPLAKLTDTEIWETDYEIPRRLLSNWIPDHGKREIVRALTPGEEARLQRRAKELENRLRPFTAAEADEVDAALCGMLSGFRALARQEGEQADASIEVLRAVLRKFPAWAIIAGCLRIARGEVPELDRRYAPNDAQVCAAVAAIVADEREKLDNAVALLTAPIEVPEPPRPTQAELEAKLGRTIGERPANPMPDWYGDGRHAERVAADIEARRRRREQAAAP